MKKKVLVVCCLVLLLTTLPIISCSHPSKEFEATVTDIRTSTSEGLVLSSLVATVYFDNGEVIPFSCEASGKVQIGERYLIKCRQTYISGWWTLDYAGKV